MFSRYILFIQIYISKTERQREQVLFSLLAFGSVYGNLVLSLIKDDEKRSELLRFTIIRRKSS